jgi:hypothetical protein
MPPLPYPTFLNAFLMLKQESVPMTLVEGLWKAAKQPADQLASYLSELERKGDLRYNDWVVTFSNTATSSQPN